MRNVEIAYNDFRPISKVEGLSTGGANILLELEPCKDKMRILINGSQSSWDKSDLGELIGYLQDIHSQML